MNYFMYISHQKFDTCRGQTLFLLFFVGTGKILSKRPIPERLYAVFGEVGGNSVTEYKTGTKQLNKINAKNSRGTIKTNAYLSILIIHVISSSSSSLSSPMNFIEVKRKFRF